MPVARIRNFLRGHRYVWGTMKMKQARWDKEFAEGRWSHIDHTEGDCVYRFIEKRCNGGSILDLGCGAGNTGAELDKTKYSDYVGVDVSEVALRKARQRGVAKQRCDKNRYAQSVIETYVPRQKYDVILFRESLYYIARWRIRSVLNRYANYLSHDGVFIVRLWDHEAHGDIVDLIESSYDVLERYLEPNKGIVITFRKARSARAAAAAAGNYWWLAILAMLSHPEEAFRGEALVKATISSSTTPGRGRVRRRAAA